MADSNAKKLAQLLDGNGDVLLTNLDNVSVTPTAVSDQDNTSTGQFVLPEGTTAQRPVTSYSGAQRYNTDLGVMEYYNGSQWLKISSELATLTSVSGTILVGESTSLTLTGKGFLDSDLVVNFTQSSDAIDEDVTVTPSSDTSATVTVPSAVYNNVTVGNAVAIKVTNSDFQESDSVNTTASSRPTGGTITSYSNYRVHTFTSSDNLVVYSGQTISNAEILLVAGGGGGGRNAGAGGGAGGMITYSGVNVSAGTYSFVVGAGGAGGTEDPGTGSSGDDTTALGYTAVGGGGGVTSGGGGSDPLRGLDGGSGGGSATETPSTNPGGSGTPGQGNNGGAGTVQGGASRTGGGGGGKTQAGQNSVSSSQAGYGGAGGTNDYQTGSNQTYAGGGGGAVHDGTGGAGGAGGGGRGGNDVPATAGTAGTGGGGGADQPGFGLAGGSGIIVMRYSV
jgi:hypothetical protein